MKKDLMSRLCLGSVQFGLNYGVANKKGKIPKREVFEILEYASSSGIDTIDTAYSYGESEKLIGQFCREYKKNFKIVSKVVLKELSVVESVSDSLDRLGASRLEAILIHSFEDFLKNGSLWGVLQNLREKRVVDKIGFSLYTPQALDELFNQKVEFDLVQVPYSIFDRRFEPYFKTLKQRKVQVYVRSVFLQGLTFLNPDNLRGNLQKAREKLLNLRRLSVKSGLSLETICLNFVLLCEEIDKVIIGIDSLKQLKCNLESINFFEKVKNIKDKVDSMMIEDEDILLPYKWALM